MPSPIQKKLNALYQKELKFHTITKFKKKSKLSAPLLLYIYQSYLDSPIKIMYVGKETNHWLTHTTSDDKKGLESVFKRGKLDLERLLERYKKQMNNPSSWKNNAFFKQYRNIQKQLLGKEERGNIVWNNLFKMSYDRGKGYSKNALGHAQLQEISKKIFLKELEILSPDIIIFVTGANYDKVIKDYFDKEYETIEIIIPRKLWKFNYKGITCYRTVHPDSLRFTKKEDRVDYYQMIIDDIKKDTEL